jgi:hypothetical protein
MRPPAGPSYEDLCADGAAAGMACRGGFHPTPEDGVPAVCGGRPARTLVLLGFTGALQWPVFTASPEYRDGEPHPLDRWSRRIIGTLARRFDAAELYPDAGPPWWPFQRWAKRAEALHLSPLGILIHPEFGLWHAYRGALAFAEAFDVPAQRRWLHPCDRCLGKPCLTSCPVEAIAPAKFDRAACMTHVGSSAGSDCRSGGCLARRSCPVGASHRYGAGQAAFHMNASLAAGR